MNLLIIPRELISKKIANEMIQNESHIIQNQLLIFLLSYTILMSVLIILSQHI